MSSSYQGPGLYEFLAEAELQQYYSAFKVKLKVQSVPQLKYVTDDDLLCIHMSKPEIKRLKRYYNKYNTHNYLNKFKKILKKKDDSNDGIVVFPKKVNDKNPIKVPSKHIIPPDAIVVHKELGSGEFGVVQQGVWTNEEGTRRQVAIKCLNKECMNNDSWSFLKEAVIMHNIDHDHIVRLYGVVLEENSLMLVTELAPLRSLLECLKEPSLKSNFNVVTLCEFSSQICDGMQYLESKRLIHRDLAARNILVFLKNRVKISDFGLSRALGVGKDYYQTNFNVNLKLPIAWCAPECINYLKFTSASDVWAFGVTLWEMFSYGFQPWAALTGQQILENIDKPNNQRLERPAHCSKEMYRVMLSCWEHNPIARPKFSDLMHLLLDARPEQLQAINSSEQTCDKNYLVFEAGDIITVLDKSPLEDNQIIWKGSLNNGKTGLFKPSHTITYFGTNIPSSSNFQRGDVRSAYSSKRRLKPEMISYPQGDFKHTSHVGPDGAYFGDISFLNGKYQQLPKKSTTNKPDNTIPSLSRASSDVSDKAPLLSHTNEINKSVVSTVSEPNWSSSVFDKDTTTHKKKDTSKSMLDHEYHEISDDEVIDLGPSLLDEVMTALNTNPKIVLTNEEIQTNNDKHEFKETTLKPNKKKHPVVKPISASDQKTIDAAISMAKELASKSMLELNDRYMEVVPETPDCWVSNNATSVPSKNIFNFKFVHKNTSFSKEDCKRKTDIQDTLSDEAKLAYNSLVDEPVLKTLHSSPVAQQDNFVESSPLRLLKQGIAVRPKIPGNKYKQCAALNSDNSPDYSSAKGTQRCSSTLSLSVSPVGGSSTSPIRLLSNSDDSESHSDVSGKLTEIDGYLNYDSSLPPLPPKTKSTSLYQEKQRHHRKHPLVMPNEDSTNVEDLNSFSSDTPKDDTVFGILTCDIVEPNGEEPNLNQMHKNPDHVSCEDLLEFACDRPNIKRTQGRAQGTDSDEVRIMTKVLSAKVTPEDCISALNTTNWEMYQAIKLIRLQLLLNNPSISMDSLHNAMVENDWDLFRASNFLTTDDDPVCNDE